MKPVHVIMLLQFAIALPAVGGAPEEAAQFAKVAREKLDLAERLVAEGDFDGAMRALNEAAMFDETVEPARRADLRARAIARQDDPAARARAKAQREQEESDRAARAAENERARMEAARRINAEALERQRKGEDALTRAFALLRENRAGEAAEQARTAKELGIDVSRFNVEADAKKARDLLARARELLRSGETAWAVEDAFAAERMGADASNVLNDVANREWRSGKRDLTGPRLREFMARWNSHAPIEARTRFERESARERDEQARREREQRTITDRDEAATRLRDARFVWLPQARSWANAYAKAMGLDWDPKEARGVLRENQVQALLAAKQRAMPTMTRLIEFSRLAEELARGDRCARSAEDCARELGLAQDEHDDLSKNMERLAREAVQARQAAMSE